MKRSLGLHMVSSWQRVAGMVAIVLVGVLFTAAAPADINIASWNLKQLGWGEQKRYDRLALIMERFDLVALQEVMGEEAVDRLVEALSTSTGEHWSSMASHSVGRGRYQEHYAFLWRDRTVEYTGGAVVFLDNRDVFAREPFSARFRSRLSGQEIALGSVHVLYGDSKADRIPEIQALGDYWDWLSEVYPDIPRLLAGDMNLEPSHEAWGNLRSRGAVPLVAQGASTLSPHDRRYANLYDQMWVTPGRLLVSEAGILRYPQLLGIDHATARATVSDHAPIYVSLGNAELSLSPAHSASFDTATMAANDAVPECIDLNTSSSKQLESLPHIGEARAALIVEGRPWRNVEALRRISGIGPSRLEDIIVSHLLCQK